jgi:hypothetical protein
MVSFQTWYINCVIVILKPLIVRSTFPNRSTIYRMNLKRRGSFSCKSKAGQIGRWNVVLLNGYLLFVHVGASHAFSSLYPVRSFASGILRINLHSVPR